jgi:hypothetical protein
MDLNEQIQSAQNIPVPHQVTPTPGQPLHPQQVQQVASNIVAVMQAMQGGQQRSRGGNETPAAASPPVMPPTAAAPGATPPGTSAPSVVADLGTPWYYPKYQSEAWAGLPSGIGGYYKSPSQMADATAKTKTATSLPAQVPIPAAVKGKAKKPHRSFSRLA